MEMPKKSAKKKRLTYEDDKMSIVCFHHFTTLDPQFDMVRKESLV